MPTHLIVPLPPGLTVATVCDAAPTQYGVDPLPPALGVLPLVVHQNVVFESRPGFDPFGVDTLVFLIVIVPPVTESTGAALVIVPFPFTLTVPEQLGT